MRYYNDYQNGFKLVIKLISWTIPVDTQKYLNLPLYQELEQLLNVQNIPLDHTLNIEGYEFKIPHALQSKLKHNQIAEPASLKKLEKLLKQPIETLGQPEDFWSLNEADLMLLQYYADLLNTSDCLKVLNQKYQNTLTEAFLQEKLQLADNTQIRIYLVKESPDLLPSDCIFLKIEPSDILELQKWADRINSRIDFECNAIIHGGCLELYGIMPHMIKRLQNLPPHPEKS